MRSLVTLITGLIFVCAQSHAQPTLQGSIQMGAFGNTANVLFLPDHNSTGGEYVNYLSISVAIPLSSATGTAPTIAGVGNFVALPFTQAVPFSYTQGTEMIYSWICTNGTAMVMSWSTGVSFVGATITFAGGNALSKIRLVDFTNIGGGANFNTFFGVGVNISPFDLTNYADQFYAISDPNGSTEGTYPSGDRFVETNALISLPVSLTSFSGYKNGNKNTLNWTTSTEVNSQGFEVQRSADGINYSSIGFVNSQATNGSSNAALNYSFNDNNPAARKQYYRLSQLDLDNRSKLSNIIVISGDKALTLTIGTMFPNPAVSVVNIMINTPVRDKVQLTITDITGKLIKQQQVNVGIGSNTIPVDISLMSKGSYLVRVTGEESTVTGKFVKL